jgi:hypothetical protein
MKAPAVANAPMAVIQLIITSNVLITDLLGIMYPQKYEMFRYIHAKSKNMAGEHIKTFGMQNRKATD